MDPADWPVTVRRERKRRARRDDDLAVRPRSLLPTRSPPDVVSGPGLSCGRFRAVSSGWLLVPLARFTPERRRLRTETRARLLLSSRGRKSRAHSCLCPSRRLFSLLPSQPFLTHHAWSKGREMLERETYPLVSPSTLLITTETHALPRPLNRLF
jgi:hypothetical protein